MSDVMSHIEALAAKVDRLTRVVEAATPLRDVVGLAARGARRPCLGLGAGASMIWRLSHRADPAALPLADRHYNRQKPGTPQFVPPGRCVVLLADVALWVTSWPFGEYVKHRWPGAWVNSLFRRESGPMASEMIREAVAVTRFIYGDPPPLGIVTFIDPDKTRRKRDPGRCYLRAGFVRDGETRGGLVAVRMPPDAMPEPHPPMQLQVEMALRRENEQATGKDVTP